MKKLITFLIILSLSGIIKAQTFTVRDFQDNIPIENVSVQVNGKISGVTNLKGEISLKLKKSDEVTFSRIGYYTKKITVGEICYGKDAVCIIYLKPKSFDLNEVVVSASKFKESKEDVPVSISVIPAREIMDINPQNTADILQKSGELFVQKSQMGGGSPVIRGFETNKILLVFDGIRMNNAIYRGGHLQNIITTDPFGIRKVEIVNGPGSVIYGSDALGGVINLHPYKPLFADTSKKVLVTGNVMSRYTSADGGNVNSIRANIASKKIASLTVFTISNFGDLRQGNIRNPFYGDWGKRFYYVERINGKDTMIRNNDVNIQTPSGYSQINLLQKFAYKHKKTVHSLNFYYTTSTNIPRYDRLNTYKNPDTLKYAEWYYGPQKWLLAYYKMETSRKTSFYEKSQITLSFQNYYESRHKRKFANDWKTNRNEHLNIFGLNADSQKDLAGIELRYGGEWYKNFVYSTAFKNNIVSGETKPTTTRYPDGGSTTDNEGVYISLSKELGEHFVINTGARYSYNTLQAAFDDTSLTHFPFTSISQQNSAVTGNLGLVYKFKKGRTAFNLSSGYRAPNVDDISKVFDSQPGLVIVPNPDLKVEKTYTADILFEKNFADIFYIGINPFYTLYRDAITPIPFTFNGKDSIMYDGEMSKVIANGNAKEAYIYGFSSRLGINMSENFELYSTATYTYGRIITDTVPYPLDHIPPFYGKTAVKYTSNNVIAEFYLLYNGWKRLKDYNVYGEDNLKNATQYGTPAWCTLNFTLTLRMLKSLDISIALENITDENYRPFASGISAPGRNLVFKINGWF